MKQVGLFLLGMLCVPTLWACGGEPTDNATARQFVWENDLLGRIQSDRWFTNGFRYSWSYGQGCPKTVVGQSVQRVSEWLLWDGADVTTNYSFGQAMYTPRNIENPNLQPTDRPWAAYAYVGLSGHAFHERRFGITEIKVGLTGPDAKGEEVQKWVHKISDSREPRGWHNQLKTRLGIQLSHARVNRLEETPWPNYLAFQYGYGGALGTLRTYATGSMSVLLGNLQSSDPPLLSSNEGDFVVHDSSTQKGMKKFFVYLTLSETLVAYNYFIEGNKRDYQVATKSHFGRVQYGVSIPFHEYFGKYWPRLEVARSIRSAEFRSPAIDPHDAIQRWGTWTFQWGI